MFKLGWGVKFSKGNEKSLPTLFFIPKNRISFTNKEKKQYHLNVDGLGGVQ
jgi:hypothetical protein